MLLLISMLYAVHNPLAVRPDAAEIKMARLDAAYDQANPPPSQENILELQNAAFQRLETQAETLASFIGVDNLHSISSGRLWRSIYDFVLRHLSKFLEDNTFSFSFSIRYSYCLYVIPLPVTDYVLIFPSFYARLLPARVKSHPVAARFLASLDRFLAEVKKRSQAEVLMMYKAVRRARVEELEILKEIPELIRSDPLKIINWLVDFKLEPITVMEHYTGE